jgi:hypothetical protein
MASTIRVIDLAVPTGEFGSDPDTPLVGRAKLGDHLLENLGALVGVLIPPENRRPRRVDAVMQLGRGLADREVVGDLGPAGVLLGLGEPLE